MNISDNIKKIREEKRLSQAEISRRLNLDPSAYFRLEKRGNKLTLEQIEDIAVALEVKPIELLGLSNSDETLEVKKDSEQNLEKRIVELKDRIKDKESIIAYQNDIINENAKLVYPVIEQYVRSKAREYGLMTYMEIVEGDKKSLKLKGKLSEVTPIFASKGIGRFQGHIFEPDLKNVIELAFKHEFHIAESMYKASKILDDQSNMRRIWERVYHRIIPYKGYADPFIDKISEDGNYKVEDVSHLSYDAILNTTQKYFSFS